MNRLPTGDLCFTMLSKPNGEHYIFVYDDDHRPELLRTFGRFASHPDLTFTWFDAAVLSQRIRDEVPAQ